SAHAALPRRTGPAAARSDRGDSQRRFGCSAWLASGLACTAHVLLVILRPTVSLLASQGQAASALSPADERERLLPAYLVDDLEDTGVEPRVLEVINEVRRQE